MYKLKNLPFIIGVFFTFILFSACMHQDPAKVSIIFIKALNNENYEDAREYSTEETGKLIDLVESLSNVASEGSVSSFGSNEVVVVSKVIDGDVARVEYTYPGLLEAQSLQLKKVDGKWLVHVTKESLTEKNLFEEEVEFEMEIIDAED